MIHGRQATAACLSTDKTYRVYSCAVTVRNSLLAILSLGECYGFQAKSEFERRTAGLWPVNVGQIYTTLDRLVRDKLVASRAETPRGGGASRSYFAITDAGRVELARWWAQPAPLLHSDRNELLLKLMLASTLQQMPLKELIAAQIAADDEDLRALRSANDDDATTSSRLYLLKAERDRDWFRDAARMLEASPRVPLALADDRPKRGRPSKGPA